MKLLWCAEEGRYIITGWSWCWIDLGCVVPCLIKYFIFPSLKSSQSLIVLLFLMETFTSCLLKTVIFKIASAVITCCSSLFKCIILDFRTLAFFPKIDLFFVVLIRDTFDFRDLPLEEPYMEFFLLSADFLCFRGLRWSELKTTFLTITPGPLLMLIFVAQSLSFSFSYLFVFSPRFFVHPLPFAFAFSSGAQFSSEKRALGSRVAGFQIEPGKGRTQHRLKNLRKITNFIETYWRLNKYWSVIR